MSTVKELPGVGVDKPEVEDAGANLNEKSVSPVRKKGSKQRENAHKRKRVKVDNSKKDAVSILLEDGEQENSSLKIKSHAKKKYKPSEKKKAVAKNTTTNESRGESKINEKDLIVKMGDLIRDLEILKSKERAELNKQDTAHISAMNKLHILITDLLFTQYFLRFPDEGTVQIKDRRLWKARRTLFLYARESRF